MVHTNLTSEIARPTKSTSFAPIAKSSIHEICVTILTFTSRSVAFNIFNIQEKLQEVIAIQ
jgi:hypothetical protein